MRRFVAGLLLAVGLAACGAVESEEQEQELLGTREDAILRCDGSVVWRLDYYSDATYTTKVGIWWCYCSGVTSKSGTSTSYSQYAQSSCR